MIEQFTKLWFERKDQIEEKLRNKHPDDYKELVRMVIEMLNPEREYDGPDPDRIHEINDGHYQGTLVYVIATTGYQPYKYWYVRVSYGSCSGCDTLEHIRYHVYTDELSPSEDQISQYMTLALHIVQGLREMGGESV